jgi:hypothetical protein
MKSNNSSSIKTGLIFLISALMALPAFSQVTEIVTPDITVSGTNTSTVAKYEKFEMKLELKNVSYQNPYNPEEIDVYAIFSAPSGKNYRINGFYDNYNNVNQWKLRFSPNETGIYNYRVFVYNETHTGKSDYGSFRAVESEHRGWIKPSDNNLHYFEYDDGTSYYATGVYSPWRNDQERFETFAKYDANLFAIWDIGYGGFVNGTGIIEEELGKYNQEKLGRIDSLLTILEKDDIKLMYAIWPHDLFSETVWAAEWDKNPYNQLIDVADVYSDSLVWEYQKQKYRYLIARFAHSRSWGIWELINEMNGTDGWAQRRHEEAYEWVKKSDKYFEEHDPYNHPTTASFSGGFNEYREPLYERNDIPNIHFYPEQGWPLKYPEDSLRSAMYNYAWATQRFWNTYDKPAIFGEAGADLAYFESNREEYHITYHNAIWASLSNGLAGIPVWWQYTHLNEQDWQHLQFLSQFVSDIDFANLPYKPVKATAAGTDVYVMDSGNHAFGWCRIYETDDISGTKIQIDKPGNGNFKVEWFNTWTGETIKTDKVAAENDLLEIDVPEIEEAKPDVAFKIFSE